MSLFEAVQNQIKSSYEYIKEEFDAGLLEQVLHPNQVIEFPITIKMDDGSTKTFIGFRSQHNNAKGSYKGGLRFHPNVSKDEVMSLSARMSLKTSVVWLPLGWWKGWIIVDPKVLSTWELEKLSRWFMQKLYKHIWPNTDIPAPDVNTNGQIMAWMVDEYSKLVGERTPWVITWKPLEIWWSQWRFEATALWGFYVLEEYLKANNNSIQGKTIIIQGAGNAGMNFAEIASNAWAKIIWMSDSKWNVYDPSGLDVNQLKALKLERKSISDYDPSKQITQEEFLTQECDILVPAALENQIHQNNANNIQTKIILELANWPTTYEADAILDAKNITVIPDVLANAGGVTVSYFEQVQNNTNYYRPKEEIYEKLQKIIKPSTLDVINTAKKYGTNLRTGAYIVSLRRILTAMKLRG